MTSTLTPWSYPSNYIGESHDGWLVFLGQNRDSDILTKSNFTCAVKALTRIASGKGFKVVRENHWACGWVEWIAISPTALKVRACAEALEKRLNQYPVVDEIHYSQMECEAVQKYWEGCSVKERIAILKRTSAKCSVFTARRDFAPDDDSVDEYLRESCC